MRPRRGPSCRGARQRGPTKSAIARTARQTEGLGGALARRLRAGDCVCLSGPLGAGKTTFIRGIMRKLGVKGSVTSPTFTLAHEAKGRVGGQAVRIAHLDFYRLSSPAAERGLLEYLDGRHIVLVEWAERDRSFWPRDVVRVKIAFDRGRGRKVSWALPAGRG